MPQNSRRAPANLVDSSGVYGASDVMSWGHFNPDGRFNEIRRHHHRFRPGRQSSRPQSCGSRLVRGARRAEKSRGNMHQRWLHANQNDGAHRAQVAHYAARNAARLGVNASNVSVGSPENCRAKRRSRSPVFAPASKGKWINGPACAFIVATPNLPRPAPAQSRR